MPQYWNLYCVSTREHKDTHGGRELGNFFFCKQAFLVRSITEPFISPKLKAHLDSLANKSLMKYEKGLLALPTDILLTLFTEYDLGHLEIGLLAITCRQLHELCGELIRESQAHYSARWRHCRIACIGEYAKFEDLPQGLLKDEDIALIRSKRAARESMNYGGVNAIAREEAWLWRGAFTYKEHWENTRWLARMRPVEREMLMLVFSVTYAPERKDWVLCNHSKKQYVRASVIAQLSGHPNDLQPFLLNCKVDLGHALLTRICWSSVDDVSLNEDRNPTKIHRGPWAGDRFSITTMDRSVLDPEEGGEHQWTDVSHEVARDLIQIYRAQYDKEWLQKMEGKIQPFDYLEHWWFMSDGEDEAARTAADRYNTGMIWKMRNELTGRCRTDWSFGEEW
ncbi:hypothetical protein C8Q76DRAFT_818212 [Earliella scabrosa]|nr:hypothetical protein C8Q76DRAFT_818212 [Earliella scabrosa]